MKNLILIAMLILSTAAMGAELDLTKSELAWKGTKVSGEHVGKISISKAKLDLNKGVIKNAEITVDMNSVTVTDLQGEWAQKFLGHLKSGDFFEVSKYPNAKLKVLKDTGKALEANLTIKDKTNKVTIPYKKNGKTYSGKLVFDRTKFGMIYGSGNFFKNLGDKMINNEVELDFKITLK